MSDTPSTAEETTAIEAPLRPVTDPTPAEVGTEELSAEALESSTPFVGQWNGLVSTTNWEKGRIIAEWREALEESDAQVTEYSDEAWARLVGGVTSQHVGRLRRAHERFGASREQYNGLYWSHFQAALDWEDAEMWLEGAITNGWSVSQMRAGRWEAVGGPGAADEQVIETQIDEDAYNALTDPEGASNGEVQSAASDKAESAERDDEADDDDAPFDTADDTATAEAQPRVQPFKDLGKLPDDVAEAFEQFKLVILSHKLTGWEQISAGEMLGALDALKALAVAPSADD